MKCRSLGMRLSDRSWVCDLCGCREREIGARLVDEYFAIVSDVLTNRGMREFYGIASRHVIKRVLLKENLVSEGNWKDKIYRRDDKNQDYSS